MSRYIPWQSLVASTDLHILSKVFEQGFITYIFGMSDAFQQRLAAHGAERTGSHDGLIFAMHIELCNQAAGLQ